MAPEQRPLHANLADYARKLQAEHDAEYLAKWEVIKTLSEALDQGFAKIPSGEHHGKDPDNVGFHDLAHTLALHGPGRKDLKLGL
ncbi:hypothetical protein B0H67DRAFT_687838 [Lasiosphaeris hirsuta]|uniref:Uncharacterized protein n=1 Tax=Lasiosphaeris hirsuta TaxID=260670 RepID=A0AA39ZSC8_9PEZI|nr:hypothetical protein B0H67DRAFT_687838 [Lasiosphaeris hirsuta]